MRGATSSLGIAFMKLTKFLYPGISITGTTRNINKTQLLLNEGFDRVVVDTDGQLQTKISFSKIIDLIGPKYIKESIAKLKPHGIVCSVGQLGNQWYLEDFDPIFELRDFKKLTSFYSGDVDVNLLNEIITMVENNPTINVKPEKIFTLNKIIEAHKYLENEQVSFGKVVVITDEDR